MKAVIIVLAVFAVCAMAQEDPVPNPFPIPTFDCPALAKPTPSTHVRQLRPGNIKAIMTIGDSITAGFAMQGLPPASFLEYRDSVYSIGAAPGAKTIFNYLHGTYNKEAVGGATGTTLPMTKGAQLDAAVSGAKIEGSLDQLNYLIKTLQQSYKSVDFNNDWKLLTIFMGANNLCGICRTPINASVASYENYLRALLQQVEARIPRVFVNLVAIFNISGVWDVAQKDLYCKSLWAIIKKECSCLQDGKAEDRHAMDLGSVGLNQVMFKVAAEYAAKNSTSFYVVVQPGLSGVRIPDFGRSFLSSLDCFHPSLAADQAFAYQLWNNMMEPVGAKTKDPDTQHIKFKCPTADTFLQ